MSITDSHSFFSFFSLPFSPAGLRGNDIDDDDGSSIIPLVLLAGLACSLFFDFFW